jgi:hypothetical protein
VDVGKVEGINLVNIQISLPERARNSGAAVNQPLALLPVDDPNSGRILLPRKGAPAPQHIYFHVASLKSVIT